ncbi:MAG: glycosyltransferase [bacterium]|nr:glycosyltransferase [bacterium]
MRCPDLAELPAPPAGRSGWPWTAASGRVESASRVSVVTPSYNQAGYLEETIRSVLLQGLPDLQYVVMDGGSTDGSVAILKKYDRWIDWTSAKDGGQSDAINTGLDKSDGALWAWINSDDVYSAGALAEACAAFGEQPDVDMFYGDCDIVDERTRRTGACPTRPFDLEPLVRNQFFIPQPSTVLRRSVLEALGGPRRDLHLVMDWELWLRVALDGRTIRHLPRTLASFRIWADAKTSAQEVRSAREKLAVLDRLYSDRDLEPAIGRYRSDAYSDVHWFASIAHRDAGEGATALGHVLRSVGRRPSRITELRTWRNLARSTVVAAKSPFKKQGV